MASKVWVLFFAVAGLARAEEAPMLEFRGSVKSLSRSVDGKNLAVLFSRQSGYFRASRPKVILCLEKAIASSAAVEVKAFAKGLEITGCK